MVLMGALGLSILLACISFAWACTVPEGYTWYAASAPQPVEPTNPGRGTEVVVRTAAATAGTVYVLRMLDREDQELGRRREDGRVIGPEEDERAAAGPDGRLEVTGIVPTNAAVGAAKFFFSELADAARCLLLPATVEVTEERGCTGPFPGGLWMDFRLPLNNALAGCERHHIPARASYSHLASYKPAGRSSS